MADTDPSSRQKKSLKVQWSRVLKEALDFDAWGQALEAVDEYEKLGRLLDQHMQEMKLTLDERSTLMKSKHALTLRIEALNDITSRSGLKLEQIRKLTGVFDELFVRTVIDFPIPLGGYVAAESTPIGKDSKEDDVFHAEADTEEEMKPLAGPVPGGGTLIGPIAGQPGQTTLSITIEKIGLKDAQTYMNPFLTIAVVGREGNMVGALQETPHSNKMKPNYVNFGLTVHIGTSLEDLKHNSCSIFFEFKHYKPKKKKVSTRCFAFLEYDEIIRANGAPMCLELYKKPTDYTKRTLNLFTIKKLYLHLKCNFHRH